MQQTSVGKIVTREMPAGREHFHIQQGLWGKTFTVLAIFNVCMSNVTHEVAKHHLSKWQIGNDLVRSRWFDSSAGGYCVTSAPRLMKMEEKWKIFPAHSRFGTIGPCRRSRFSCFLSSSSFLLLSLLPQHHQGPRLATTPLDDRQNYMTTLQLQNYPPHLLFDTTKKRITRDPGGEF